MSGHRIAATLVAAWLCAAPAAAQTIAEDEARIEELIARELAVAGKVPPADPGVAPQPATPPRDDAVAGRASASTDAAVGTEPPATGATESVAAANDVAALEPPAEPTIFDAAPPPDPAEIAITDLAANAGRFVRVRSVGGRTHVGKIESVGADSVKLRVRMGGGYATFDLSFAQIATVKRL